MYSSATCASSCQHDATWWQPLYKHEATQDGQTLHLQEQIEESF